MCLLLRIHPSRSRQCLATLACALSLAAGPVLAQEVGSPHIILKPVKERGSPGIPGPVKETAASGKTVEEVRAIKQRAAEWRSTCLLDWDAQTHMTKAEWRATCDRVTREREQFMLQSPSPVSLIIRKR